MDETNARAGVIERAVFVRPLEEPAEQVVNVGHAALTEALGDVGAPITDGAIDHDAGTFGQPQRPQVRPVRIHAPGAFEVADLELRARARIEQHGRMVGVHPAVQLGRLHPSPVGMQRVDRRPQGGRPLRAHQERDAQTERADARQERHVPELSRGFHVDGHPSVRAAAARVTSRTDAACRAVGASELCREPASRGAERRPCHPARQNRHHAWLNGRVQCP